MGGVQSGLLHLRIVIVILLFSIHHVKGVPEPETATPNDTAEASDITTPSKVSAANVSANELRNALHLMLLQVNKQPHAETLKSLGQLVNDVLKQDPSNKESQGILMDELKTNEKLKNLLENLKPDANNSSANSSVFELFPTKLRDAIIEEVIKYHKLSESPETNEESNSSDPSSEQNPEQTTESETNSATDKESSETSSPDTTEDSVNTAAVTVIKSDEPAEKTEHVGNKNISKLFSPLSEELLNILHNRSLKYVRTYSEILEPISKANKGNANKNKNKGKYKSKGNANKNKNKNKKPNNKKKKGCNCAYGELLTKVLALMNEYQKSPQAPKKGTILEMLAHITPKPSTNLVTKKTRTSLDTTRQPNRPPGNRIESRPLTTLSVFPTPSVSGSTEF